MTPGLEVLFVLVIFLGLLAAGMAIPFAIGVPAIVYLLLHGGVPALRRWRRTAPGCPGWW